MFFKCFSFLVVQDIDINHSSENLKVIYKAFFVDARISFQLKTSELKNVETLVDQAV